MGLSFILSQQMSRQDDHQGQQPPLHVLVNGHEIKPSLAIASLNPSLITAALTFSVNNLNVPLPSIQTLTPSSPKTPHSPRSSRPHSVSSKSSFGDNSDRNTNNKNKPPVKSFITSLNTSFKTCVESVEKESLLGEGFGCCFRFCWGAFGILPKAVSGTTAFACSMTCGLAALCTSPACLCGKDWCGGACSSSMSTLGCDCLRFCGTSVVSISAELCCESCIYCSNKCCQSKKIEDLEKCYFRSAASVLSVNTQSKNKYAKVVHLDEKMTRVLRKCFLYELCREGAGGHRIHEKIRSAFQKRDSQFFSPNELQQIKIQPEKPEAKYSEGKPVEAAPKADLNTLQSPEQSVSVQKS